MPELNKANRQCADVDIRILKTMKPFLFFDTANTTTVGLTGETVYAMAKGTKKIGFQDPLDGTMTIEAQVYPFKLFSLFSDGVVESDSAYAGHTTVTCEEAGTLPLTVENGEIQDDAFYVYPKGLYGEDDSIIAGTYEDGTFTADTADDIEEGEEYEIGYMVTRDAGVQRVSFSNTNLPNDYYITMETIDKDEDGVYTPFLMTIYKASIQRSFELSFSSEGDPATVTMNFDLFEDKNGKTLDFTELTDDAY